MKRKRLVLSGIVLAAAVALAVGLAYHARTGRNSGPVNVLLITLDTTRADRLGCYGYAQAETPALDGLARQGLRFQNALSHVPMTLPSHATMLTGLLPPEHGLRDNGRGRLGPKATVLAETFAAHGYKTAAFLASFVLDKRFGLDRGFEVYDDRTPQPKNDPNDQYQRENPGNVVADRALAWLEKNADKPFFAWVHFYDPHLPYAAPEPYKSRHAEHPYDGEVAFMDAQVKRLLDFLDRRGLRAKTLIIACGDHGESFGEHQEYGHGPLVYDNTLRVPLLVCPPRRMNRPAKVVDRVAGLADVTPTVLDAMGWKSGQKLSGQSLLGDLPADRACYSESDFLFESYGWAPLKSVTTVRWKYIDCPDPELYDLAGDPREEHNLFSSQPKVAGELKDRLARMEAAMIPGQAEAAPLDKEALGALKALGYLAGSGSPGTATRPEARLDPKAMMPIYNACIRGENLLKAGEIQQAIDLLNPVLANSPDALEAHRLLASAYLAQDRFADARPHVEASLKRHPDDRAMWANLGTIVLEQKKYDDAIKLFRYGLRLPVGAMEVVSDSGISPVTAKLRVHMGVALMNLDKNAEAAEQFKMVLADDPNNLMANNDLGAVYLNLKQYDLAIEHYLRALRQQPRHEAILMNLVEVYEKSGRLDDAAAKCREVLRWKPYHAGAACELGVVLSQQKHYAEAFDAWRQGLAADPNQPDVNYYLAWWRATCPEAKYRDGAEAVKRGEILAARSGKIEAKWLDALAAGYAEVGRFPDALATARKALAQARSDKAAELAGEIEKRIELYAADKAYHQPP